MENKLPQLSPSFFTGSVFRISPSRARILPPSFPQTQEHLSGSSWSWCCGSLLPLLIKHSCSNSCSKVETLVGVGELWLVTGLCEFSLFFSSQPPLC